MNSIHIQQVNTTDEIYQQVWQLREDILRKPIGLSLRNEDLSADADDIILVALSNGSVVGCLMLQHIDNATIKLRQMAVHNEWQGQGIGRQLVGVAEQMALARGYNVIKLHARKEATGFYLSMGYYFVGDEFTEVGIPHFIMQKAVK